MWSGEGARRFGQRWNPPGLPAIYTGTSFALCLVEILVHANGRAPPSAARCVQAVVPAGLSCETFLPARHPGWDDLDDTSVAQAFGRAWIEEGRSAVLLVPSIVTGGRDTNAVINPRHPDAARIAIGPESPASFDPRLFPASETGRSAQ